MAILKVKRMASEARIWINTDNIAYWEDWNGCAAIVFAGDLGTSIYLDISPDDLTVAIDPENACPDPSRCLYFSEYCARGAADLTHGGFHAAEKEGAAHISACTWTQRTGNLCDRCRNYEQLVRV